jgi:hypothetical protein
MALRRFPQVRQLAAKETSTGYSPSAWVTEGFPRRKKIVLKGFSSYFEDLFWYLWLKQNGS